MHHVLDDAESPHVAGIDEALVSGRAAVALMHGVPEHAVVAPVVRAVERVHRQQLDEPDAELDEMIESLDRGVEGARGRERADVQFVDDRARELASRPRGVLPLVRTRIEPRAEVVHTAGLAARTGVGAHRGGVVEHESVFVAVGKIDGCGEPAALARLHRRETEAGAVQLHRVSPGRPDLDHADPSTAAPAATSSATG